MKYHTCQRSYIGQTGHRFDFRYKEHLRYITTNNPKSSYANYILLNIYEYGPIETTITLLQAAQKGRGMSTLENYYTQL